MAIIPRPRGEIVDPVAPRPWWRNPFVLLFGTALGASLLSASVVAIVLTRAMPSRETIVQVPVVITAAPVAQQQAPSPVPTREVAAPPVQPTSVPTRPPATATAEPTEVPSGPQVPGVRLPLAQSVTMTLVSDSLQLSQGRPLIKFLVRNDSNRPFVFRMDRYAVSAEDNQGRRFKACHTNGFANFSCGQDPMNPAAPITANVAPGTIYNFDVGVETTPGPQTRTLTISFENISGTESPAWVYTL